MSTMKTPTTREAVLLQALINGDKYGRELRDAYEKQTGKRMPLGSLYVTLDRMEVKGFLASRLGESVSSRGGNRRKYYRIQASGHVALSDYQAVASSIFFGRANNA